MKQGNHLLACSFALATAFVLAFSQTPAFAQTNNGNGQNQKTVPNAANRMQEHHQAMQARMNKRFADIAQLLSLNADQRAKAQTIFQHAWASAQPIVAQLSQNRTAIAGLIASNASPTQFNAQIVKCAEREGSLVSQLVTVRTQAVEQFRNLLNPAQRQKATDLYALMTSRMPFGFDVPPGQQHPMMSSNRMMGNKMGNR